MGQLMEYERKRKPTKTMSHTRLHKNRVYKTLLRDNYTRRQRYNDDRELLKMMTELHKEGLVD
jgi:hypothetical protein